LHAINYEASSTLNQAVSILKTHGENARPFCGGTDILIQLRAGVRRTEHLVDVKKIKELRTLSFDAKKGLRLGAAVPCIDISESDAWCRRPAIRCTDCRRPRRGSESAASRLARPPRSGRGNAGPQAGH